MPQIRTKSVAVIGAEGQLGAELCRQMGEEAVGYSREACDLLNAAQVISVLQQQRPAVVINAAAYTAVDLAEQEPALCRAINADAVAMLADYCDRENCLLVQISTDYVFGQDHDRRVPYTEGDAPGPVNTYGQSKREGEINAMRCPKHLVVRTCGLYGRRTKPTQSNFVDTILRLARQGVRLRVVDDQICSPSSTISVARAIRFLVAQQATGLFHVVDEGAITWHALATEIFRQAGLAPDMVPISTAEYGAPAPRPSYSVLDTSKYQALGGPPLPHWKQALAEYLQTIN